MIGVDALASILEIKGLLLESAVAFAEQSYLEHKMPYRNARNDRRMENYLEID